MDLPTGEHIVPNERCEKSSAYLGQAARHPYGLLLWSPWVIRVSITCCVRSVRLD